MTPAESVVVDPPPLDRRVVMSQQWMELAYVHWRYDPSVVQGLLPDGLGVDIHDGSAWVGLIPFDMRRVRLGPTPPLPYFGTFEEINVRTYVVDARGRRAVWFFSLDVPRLAVVGVARTLFALPYCWARTTHERDGARHRYTVRRRWPRDAGALSDMAFTVGAAIPPDDEDPLDHFISARWALVTRRRGRLAYGRVSHPRWVLHRVDDVRIDDGLLAAAGLPSPSGEPHVRYAPGVDVELGWLEPVDAVKTVGPPGA